MEEKPKSEGLSPTKSDPAERIWSKILGASPSKSETAKTEGVSLSKGDPLKVERTALEKLLEEQEAPRIEQLAKYKQLVARAVDVFGDEIKASKWLSLPNAALDGDTPLQVAHRNSYDGQVLERIFIRIEHGIYF